MKLTILGTGNALVTECYNTCFVLSDGNQHFLVDGGGGNGILKQLKSVHIPVTGIHDIFVTHKHIDHVMGIIWMIRAVCQKMNQGNYQGICRIYAHDELIPLIRNMAFTLLQAKEVKHMDDDLIFIPLKDGDSHEITGHQATFFDIRSTKAKQFGFTFKLENDQKLTCCGDEPYQEHEYSYAVGSTWLMHEAFCLYSQAEQFRPYEKHHSTVMDACKVAEALGVKNLILYHTEDKNIENRKALYYKEGSRYYTGNLYIPDDLEIFEL